MHSKYCESRFNSIRRKSRVVKVGEVPIGGNHPIVVQSMTTTPTIDVTATVKQCIALAEAECEVIRITAQNLKAAEALKDIRKEFNQAGFSAIPLVADIHFLPKAAMESVKHVEKVRINPGNYVDQKKFKIREYSDSQYSKELEKLHEAFSPIVLKCKEYGRAMRIGTNHGSLSDRIMNRYGDTPLGMCESALEFLRIAESHNFKNIILSMKASNPRVMIQAYRLMVHKMDQEDMAYPLHLGVTEAGDGDDARIKSAIGIGSLLCDGLGDTIRVSLTEDPVAEVPVAKAIAEKAHLLWGNKQKLDHKDSIDPFEYSKRDINPTTFGKQSKIGTLEPPIVIHSLSMAQTDSSECRKEIAFLQRKLKDAKIEGLLIPANKDAKTLNELRSGLEGLIDFVLWDFTDGKIALDNFSELNAVQGDGALIDSVQLEHCQALEGLKFVIATTAEEIYSFDQDRINHFSKVDMITLRLKSPDFHAIGSYRALIEALHRKKLKTPLWIRNQKQFEIETKKDFFGNHLIEASILSGSLFSDGIGDAISIESVNNDEQSVTLAYNILQGSRARTVKTEYVACPSCGRTLFDLQSTTQMIRKATGHLKGVTIAVMGCIVNGPGEMADADFGYVGGAPGKINLYVGKECVQYHIPADEAVEALIALIKKHGKWIEPKG